MTKGSITRLVMLVLLAVTVGACDETEGRGGDTASQTGTKDAMPRSGFTGIPLSLKQVVSACNRSVDVATPLSGPEKAFLKQICREALAGDREDIAFATREVCVSLAEEVIPRGTPGREAILLACANDGYR